MAHAYTLNSTLFNSGETFYGIWKLIRTMLAAGYRYHASGNGQSGGSKDTSGDVQNDLWAYAGGVHLSAVASGGTGSGSGVSIGAGSATTGLSTITGVSGFTASSVGRYITITGSVNAENNQNFRIVSQAGTSVTVYGPDMVAETGNASIVLTEVYGGADGSITTYTSTGSPLINFTTSSFNSFSAADVGNRITILNSGSGNNGTYVIAQFVSTNNVLLYSPSNSGGTAPFITASDAGNPTLQWVEFDPRQQGYPLYISAANGVGAWYNIQGPSVLKIPIGSNVSTGTFIRGENVTQTTTGAQGEILGYQPDSSGGTGFLVISPRIYGTGVQATGVRGWNASANTDTITGALSGATVTTPASSTPIDYVCEWVFWKNTATQGHIYYQRIDRNPATESSTTSSVAGRFSTMATSGTVTAQVAPASSAGSNPTTNGFPTVGSYVVIGTATNGSVSTQSGYWSSLVLGTSPGRFHCLVANAIESSGVSADGTWHYLQSCSGAGYQGMAFERMDNQEDGDLDPYIHQVEGNSTQSSTSRTQDAIGGGSATDSMNTATAWWNNGSFHGYKGIRRRGLSGESFNVFSTGILYDFSAGGYVIQVNNGNPELVATAPSTTYVR